VILKGVSPIGEGVLVVSSNGIGYRSCDISMTKAMMEHCP